MGLHLDVFFRLLIAHFLADFTFQSTEDVSDKRKQGFRSSPFLKHIAIVGVLTYVCLWDILNWQIPMVVILTHALIDWIKIRAKHDTTTVFLLDQVAHVIVLLLCATFLVKHRCFPLPPQFIYNEQWLAIALVYLLNTRPFGILIGKLTQRWREMLDEKDQKAGLNNAGEWIGMLERILVVTLVLAGELGGLGFLLAAKSIFRFGDLTKANDRKMTEYILIGTLLSFALALLSGLVFLKLFNY